MFECCKVPILRCSEFRREKNTTCKRFVHSFKHLTHIPMTLKHKQTLVRDIDIDKISLIQKQNDVSN